MTTTVDKPGFGWDDEPSTTISPIKTKSEKKYDGTWGDEPDKASVPARRKIKTSELPLSSATRTAIEGLSHKFKKKGGYDAIRKQVWTQLEGSEFEKELMEKVKNVAISTLESNPSLLSSTAKKSRILVEGHIDRSGVYQDAEKHITDMVRQHVESMDSEIRRLRIAEVGELEAGIEKRLGSKTDAEYEEDLRQIREERTEKRLQEKIEREEREKEEREQREKERERLEKIEDDKREKERKDREAARKAARRETRPAPTKAYAGESTSTNNIGADARDRGRYDERVARGRGRGSGSRGRGGSARGRGSRENSRAGRRPSATQRVEKILTREEQERLEHEAMAELLRDGKKANRNRYQAEPEIDETLAPPPRKAMPSSAIKPIDRDPPPVKKEPTSNIKIEDRDTKSDRPPSRFDIKHTDIDRRDKPRDRGYARGGSGDRGGRSRRSSRDRLDRIDRRRSRSRDARRRDDRLYDDRDRDRRSTRDSRDLRDARDTRDRDIRPRSPVRERDTHTRRRSRSPARSPPRKPSESLTRSASTLSTTAKTIPPIDPTRDPVLGLKDGAPTGRKFIDREAEARKLIEAHRRAAEAKAFMQQREEAKEKGLPMPGYDRPGIEREVHERSRERVGSGTPGLGRGRGESRPEWRQSAPNGGFATPGPRDIGSGRARSIDRPPSRNGPGSVFRSRENTPIPAGPRRESVNGNRILMDIALDARDRRSATPVNANVKVEGNAKVEQPSPALTRHSRRDSTEAGEIVAGAPDVPTRYDGGGSVRRKSRSRSRDRRRDEREKPRADSRERRRRDERDDRRDTRDDRRDSRRDDTRERRDDRDRRPRSRSRDRDRRYRSRSRDSRRPRDSGRSFGGRR